MSDQADEVRTASLHASGESRRVLWHRCLLALNLAILTLSVYVVWTRLASVDDADEPPRDAPPLHTFTGAGVAGGGRSPATDDVGDDVGDDEPAPEDGDPGAGGTRSGAVPAGGVPPRVAGGLDLDLTDKTPPRVGATPVATTRSAGRNPVVVPPRVDDVPPPPLTWVDPPLIVERGQDAVTLPSAPLDDETRKRITGTQRRIGEVGKLLEVLSNKVGGYPTSARAFGDHRGIEALHVALVTHDRGDGLNVGDADGDGRLEILDDWGRPLVYFSNDDYGTYQTWTSGGARWTLLTSAHSRFRDVPHAAARFQLWSAGPNGRNELGSGDDITSWVLRD